MARYVIQQEEEERQCKTLHHSSCSCLLWQPFLSLFFTSLLSTLDTLSISHHFIELLFLTMLEPYYCLCFIILTPSACPASGCIMLHPSWCTLSYECINFRYKRRHNVGRLHTESIDQEKNTPEVFQLGNARFLKPGEEIV